MRPLTLMGKIVMIDQDDAPWGYHPIPKELVRPSKHSICTNHNENICRSCDWRPDCQKAGPDNTYFCVSEKRKDGISVVFRKSEPKKILWK